MAQDRKKNRAEAVRRRKGNGFLTQRSFIAISNKVMYTDRQEENNY